MKDWNVHGYNNDVCSTWNEPPLDENMTAAKRNLQKYADPALRLSTPDLDHVRH
jgi:hypothetical protein